MTVYVPPVCVEHRWMSISMHAEVRVGADAARDRGLLRTPHQGTAVQRLSPTDVGLQLLENSLVTGAALVALILALQPVSGSFNPVVTLVERALGAIGSREAGA